MPKYGLPGRLAIMEYILILKTGSAFEHAGLHSRQSYYESSGIGRILFRYNYHQKIVAAW